MNPGGENVKYFRLENLSSEWQTGAYNSTNNPFGKVVRCQDCHMSHVPVWRQFPYQTGGMTGYHPDAGRLRARLRGRAGNFHGRGLSA